MRVRGRGFGSSFKKRRERKQGEMPPKSLIFSEFELNWSELIKFHISKPPLAGGASARHLPWRAVQFFIHLIDAVLLMVTYSVLCYAQFDFIWSICLGYFCAYCAGWRCEIVVGRVSHFYPLRGGGAQRVEWGVICVCRWFRCIPGVQKKCWLKFAHSLGKWVCSEIRTNTVDHFIPNRFGSFFPFLAPFGLRDKRAG